jgi:hypothetical protein
VLWTTGGEKQPQIGSAARAGCLLLLLLVLAARSLALRCTHWLSIYLSIYLSISTHFGKQKID